MAHLIWDSINGVEMRAEEGEKISPELASAYGQARTAQELVNIGHWIEEINDTLARGQAK
jgi:hypothetical protein